MSALYDTARSQPLLHGNRCTGCDTVYFPSLPLGCEVCGATGLVAEELDTRGTLWARAGLSPELVVAEVVLDAGPKIRVLLADGPAETGQRVRAVWCPVGDPPGVEPRWTVEDAG